MLRELISHSGFKVKSTLYLLNSSSFDTMSLILSKFMVMSIFGLLVASHADLRLPVQVVYVDWLRVGTQRVGNALRLHAL